MSKGLKSTQIPIIAHESTQIVFWETGSPATVTGYNKWICGYLRQLHLKEKYQLQYSSVVQFLGIANKTPSFGGCNQN